MVLALNTMMQGYLILHLSLLWIGLVRHWIKGWYCYRMRWAAVLGHRHQAACGIR